MPHIHTKPNQHDMTISAYIIRREDDEWKCLVHFHKKMEKLMQIGGHIELDETPWQAVAHELEEESGYTLGELNVIQHTADMTEEHGSTMHPTPFTMNTHNVGNDHYHSDLCYGFVARQLPQQLVSGDESTDLRWMTLDEMAQGVDADEVLKDVLFIYRFLLAQLAGYVLVPAKLYSLTKPKNIGIVYKRGAPGV